MPGSGEIPASPDRAPGARVKVITHQELIARKVRVAKIGVPMGFALTLAGIIIYWLLFINTQGQTFSLAGFLISWGLLLLGFGIGSYSNRQMTLWVQEPRADQALGQALKGLDDRHYLYNYLLPANHVLLAPSGVFVLKAKGVEGRVYCSRDRWRRDFSLGRFIRGFAPEPLGNPSREALKEVAALHSFIQRRLPDQEVAIEGVVVFTSPKVYLEVGASSLPVLHLRGLKAHLRKLAKQDPLPTALRQTLQSVFEEATGG